MHMSRMFLPLVFLLIAHQNGDGAQMEISITTFGPPAAPGAPNTFIGTGSQIASSLLESDTPALLWGVVSSNDVNAVCQHIVNTGNMNFSATVHAAPLSGGYTDTSTVNMQITAIEGCLAASDGSGTEAIVAASDGRQYAVVCPSDAGSKGCGVYFTGDDVIGILSQGNRRSLLGTTTTYRSRKLLATSPCETGAQKGAIGGAIGGAMDAAGCLGLGPLAPFCAVGVIGAGAELGAAGGCAAGSVSSGCFPGDATVLLANGEVMNMGGLGLGEKVAVRKQDGAVAYEDIYAFGHKDASASGHYIQLSLEPMTKDGNISDPALESELDSRTLELTPLHFAQVFSGECHLSSLEPDDLLSMRDDLDYLRLVPQAPDRLTRTGTIAGPDGEILYKRAQDIRVGDMMWVLPSNAAVVTSTYVVTGVSAVMKQGLYNPFTLSGTIIVKGVAASTHSDWFLDKTFDFLGLTQRLPTAYQIILSPIRTLYYILGKEAYISLYHHLDALINVPDLGTKYGGQLMMLTTITMSTSSMFAAVVISQLQSKLFKLQ